MTDTLLAMPTKHGHAFGIMSRPDSPSHLAAVVLPGADDFRSTSPFLSTLSHALATAGIASLRIDYLDFGESSGGIAELAPDEPGLEEVSAAVALLKEWGHSEVVLIGHCYGARVALAAVQLGGVVGEVLLSPPSRLPRRVGTTWTSRQLLQRVARPRNWVRLAQPANRALFARVVRRFVTSRRLRRGALPAHTGRAVSPNLLRGLKRLQRHEIRAVVVFGEQDASLGYLRSEADSQPDVAALLAGTLPFIDLEILPGSVHEIRGHRIVELMLEAIVEWTKQRSREVAHA